MDIYAYKIHLKLLKNHPLEELFQKSQIYFQVNIRIIILYMVRPGRKIMKSSI